MSDMQKENGTKETSNTEEKWIETLVPMPTRRELEIMRLAMHGYTTKAIAAELFIEPGTVEVHRSNIIKKLRSGNFTAAVVMAIRNGWIKY